MKAAAALSGAREVVILLDRSASMGYGDHWARAQAEAKKVVATIGGEDKATLVLFGTGTEEAVRATGDASRLEAAIGAADGVVRRHALRAGAAAGAEPAGAVRAAAQGGRAHQRLPEVRLGAAGGDSLPEGATLTPISVASLETSNLAVTSVEVPAHVVLRRGARDGDGRPHQSQRRPP